MPNPLERSRTEFEFTFDGPLAVEGSLTRLRRANPGLTPSILASQTPTQLQRLLTNPLAQGEDLGGGPIERIRRLLVEGGSRGDVPMHALERSLRSSGIPRYRVAADLMIAARRAANAGTGTAYPIGYSGPIDDLTRRQMVTLRRAENALRRLAGLPQSPPLQLPPRARTDFGEAILSAFEVTELPRTILARPGDVGYSSPIDLNQTGLGRSQRYPFGQTRVAPRLSTTVAYSPAAASMDLTMISSSGLVAKARAGVRQALVNTREYLLSGIGQDILSVARREAAGLSGRVGDLPTRPVPLVSRALESGSLGRLYRSIEAIPQQIGRRIPSSAIRFVGNALYAYDFAEGSFADIRQARELGRNEYLPIASNLIRAAVDVLGPTTLGGQYLPPVQRVGEDTDTYRRRLQLELESLQEYYRLHPYTGASRIPLPIEMVAGRIASLRTFTADPFEPQELNPLTENARLRAQQAEFQLLLENADWSGGASNPLRPSEEAQRQLAGFLFGIEDAARGLASLFGN